MRFDAFAYHSAPSADGIRTAAVAAKDVNWFFVQFRGHHIWLRIRRIEPFPVRNFAEERRQSARRKLQIP